MLKEVEQTEHVLHFNVYFIVSKIDKILRGQKIYPKFFMEVTYLYQLKQLRYEFLLNISKLCNRIISNKL
jgi:hypothetical protein